MKLTSYGAAQGVTGSCHVIETGAHKIMLDCGIFQGRQGREQNEPPLPFDASSIDIVLVSHAHLDHIGRLPLLPKEGFAGRVLSNRATYELARVSLLDSARIIDSDTRRRNKRRRDGEAIVEALYDDGDVLELIDLWNEYVDYDQRTEILPGVHATFFDAGHILGSSFILLEAMEQGQPKRFLFSGDLGNVDKPIINDPTPPPTADVVLMESTYGDRSHRPFDQSVVELEAAICDTVERGGNLLIPSFAMERAQELLYVLYEAWRAGRIPQDVHIYLDSPMAINVTKIFTRFPGYFDQDALDMAKRGGNPFEFPALSYTRSSSDSKDINQRKHSAIIVAGSGMCSGGRILHHLKHNLHRPECGVVFCGYQASGSLGRRIVNGDDEVYIHRQPVEVRAKVYTIGGFSGHAGQDTLTEWAQATQAQTIVLVHGEQDVREAFARHLKKQGVGAETINQSFENTVEF